MVNGFSITLHFCDFHVVGLFMLKYNVDKIELERIEIIWELLLVRRQIAPTVWHIFMSVHV